MNIVLVSFWSPQSTEAASRRVRQYTGALGSNLCVVTSPSRVPRVRVELLKNGCQKVYLVPFPHFLDCLYGVDPNNPSDVQSGLCSHWLRKVMPRLRDAANTFLVPDFRLVWSIAATPYIIGLRPDVLVTTGPPMSTHWVGLIMRNIRRRMVWVVDLQDQMMLESSGPSKNGLHTILGRRYAKKVLEFSTKVICTTEAIIENCLSLAPDTERDKFVTVELGWEQASLVSYPKRDKGKTMDIKYFGNIDRRRPVGPLFRALAECFFRDVVRIKFYGTRNTGEVKQEAKLAGIEGLVSINPYVCGESFYHEMNTAFALLTIQGPEYSYAISSKVLDYLPLNSWILGLVPPQSCEFDLLSKVGGAVLANPEDVRSICTALETLYGYWVKGLYPRRNEDIVRQYDSSLLQDKLRHIIEVSVRETLESKREDICFRSK